MKKRLTTGLLIISISLISTITCDRVALSIPTTKTEQIRELLEITGSGDIGVQVMESMVVQMRQSTPNVPSEWWDKFMTKLDPKELTELVVPIYEKHFTEEEITAMLEFYKSSVGQSIISKTSVVTQESSVMVIKYLPNSKNN